MRVLALSAVVLVAFALWKAIRAPKGAWLTEETLGRIRREDESATRVRELDEMTRGKRAVLDGPARPSRAFDRVVGR